MLIVNDIELINTRDERSVYEFAQVNWPERAELDPESLVEYTVYRRHGRQFRNREGITIMLAWSPQVENALSMPLDHIDTLEQRNEELYLTNWALRERIRQLEELSLWQIIKKKLKPFFTL